jgi:hypothetical protein
VFEREYEGDGVVVWQSGIMRLALKTNFVVLGGSNHHSEYIFNLLGMNLCTSW